MASEFGDKKVFDSVADLQDPSRSTLSSLFTYLYKTKKKTKKTLQRFNSPLCECISLQIKHCNDDMHSKEVM